MKILKIIGIVIGAIVALALALVLTLPLWLGPVVKPSASAAVPKLTKTNFKLEHLYLNPYTGRFELGGMELGNPAGYDEPCALAISNLVVDVDMSDLSGEYVHIEEVTVEDLFVSVVSGGENKTTNFKQIQYNLAGGKEKYEAKQAEAEAKAEAEAMKPAAKAEDEEEKPIKLIIDKLTVKGIRIKLGPVTLPVPGITLTDLGKKSNGMTWDEMLDSVWQAILKAASSATDGAKLLGGLLGNGANLLGQGANKAANTVGEGANKALNRVGEGANKVGEGASKAVDAFKGLFK